MATAIIVAAAVAVAGVAGARPWATPPPVSCTKLRLARARPMRQPCVRATRSGALPPASPRAFPGPPAPNRTARWLSYLTDVDPGSAIEFTSASTGYRVTGEGMVAHLDDHLAAGPAGAAVVWPGSAVSKSTDGGRSWRPVVQMRDGVWGIDFRSPTTGWAVGVTSLLRTTDGGQSWSAMSEPPGHPLVAVQFVSRDRGYGLTTVGALFVTVDGGLAWRALPLPARATALCFTSARVGYVADLPGDVYATADGAATWRTGFTSPVAEPFKAVWSELACGPDGVWQAIRVFSPLLRGVEPYLVAYRAAGAPSWREVASNLQRGAVSALAKAASSAPLAVLGGIAPAFAGRAYLAGAPVSGVAVGVSLSGSQGEGRPALARLTATRGAAEAMPAGREYVQVHGVSARGSRAWVDAVDAAVGTAQAARFSTLVLSSSDAGRSWTVVNDSGPQAPPPYSP